MFYLFFELTGPTADICPGKGGQSPACTSSTAGHRMDKQTDKEKSHFTPISPLCCAWIGVTMQRNPQESERATVHAKSPLSVWCPVLCLIDISVWAPEGLSFLQISVYSSGKGWEEEDRGEERRRNGRRKEKKRREKRGRR